MLLNWTWWIHFVNTFSFKYFGEDPWANLKASKGIDSHKTKQNIHIQNVWKCQNDIGVLKFDGSLKNQRRLIMFSNKLLKIVERGQEILEAFKNVDVL